MKRKLFVNIGWLAGVGHVVLPKRGKDLNDLAVIHNAFLLVEDGLIQDYGAMVDFSPFDTDIQIIDLHGKCILPCWVDSHTHLLHAANREDEFLMKLQGKSYEEIAASGGGILSSAKKIAETSEEELLEIAKIKLSDLIKLGTGAIEIKSGYGLTVEGELKMLRVLKTLKEQSPIPIRITFLGAHSFLPQYKQDHQAYINLIIEEMLPVIAAEKLADYVDVFCEKGFYSPEETLEICRAAAAYGLPARLHVNQLHSIGGIETGMAVNAVSLDHLETLTENEIELLGKFHGCATLLPGAAFFLRMPFQPARKLIDAGAAVVLASDYNPGSCPSGNMHFIGVLSCIQMKMLPAEVINASTINAAHSLSLQNETGSISKGKLANFIITFPLSTPVGLYYNFGGNYLEQVYINGEIFEK